MRKLVFTLGFLVFSAGGSQAATLDVLDGQLVGASGVNVGGVLYDVQFGDGSCVSLYGGCDQSSDFTFQTEAQATLAINALLDQVLIDGPDGLFYSYLGNTNGCDIFDGCWIIIPFSPPDLPSEHSAVVLFRDLHPCGIGDEGCVPEPDTALILGEYLPLDFDSGVPAYEGNISTFATWQGGGGGPSVPEPSTALLLGFGLTGLTALGRRVNL